MRRVAVPTIVCVVMGLLVAGAGPAAAQPAAAPAIAQPAAGRYVPVPTVRVLDTRRSTTPRGPIVARQSFPLTLPQNVSGAAAVVLHVAVLRATRPGFATVYPDGVARPTVANVNFPAAQTTGNLVIVKVGADRTVDLYNGSSGTVQFTVDLSGYYTSGATAPAGQGDFQSLQPLRILDTRYGIGNGVRKGPIAAKHVAELDTAITDAGQQVPPTASAVVLNVAVVSPTTSGYISAYPGDGPRPNASALNFPAGRSVSNLVVVPLGPAHIVDFYVGATSGSTHVVADIAGYFLAGDPVTAGSQAALAPDRLLDTRNGIGRPGVTTPVGGGKTITLQVAGRGGVPRSGVTSAVLNLAALRGAGSGFLTVRSSGSGPATTSSLNYQAGRSVANLVLAPLSATGSVTIYNGSSAPVDIVADVSGYTLAKNLPLPPTSRSHYVRSVSSTPGHFGDPGSTGVGCQDAKDGDAFVLLDIGAQSNDRTGVKLSVVGTSVTYADLVTAINAYVTSYRTCGAARVTVAVGTNNGGDFEVFTPAGRGTAWADQVVDAIAPVPGVTVAGANDIEAGFGFHGARQDQLDALTWEKAFIAATPAHLDFNGSADGCPDTYDSAAAACESTGWTQADYYKLVHNGSRISALPQIYFRYQARQWANIDRLGGGAIDVTGSLTESAADCTATDVGACDMLPAAGWATLYHALSTEKLPADLQLPVSADLDVLT